MSRIDSRFREIAPHGVEFKPLGEVGTFIRGNGLQKADLTVEGVPAIHYGQIHTVYRTWTRTTVSFTSPELATTLRRAKPGDLVIATTSEDDAAVAKATAWMGDEEAAVSGDAYIYRHGLDPRYVAYFFQSTQFRDQKLRYITGTKVRRVSGEALARIRIPVPPLELQREIVTILDHFTELEAKLESKLEAELEARRKQYASYRQRLLIADSPQTISRELGDIAANLDNRRRPVTRAHREVGEYPYYGANGVQDYVSDYIFDGTFLLIGEDGSVIQKNGSPVLNWATGKIWVNNHAHVLVEKTPDVKLRFLFHYLQTLDISAYVTGGTQPKLNQGNLNRIPVLVPPLAHQERIVDILDNFDGLLNELFVGLPAELAGRRQQYEYYRDRLLTFPEAS